MQDETVTKTIAEKDDNAFFGFISKHKFISSLLLCLLFFLIYLPINGFRIYSGGDDPGIIKLISNGELSIGFVGYFFAYFVSLIQPLFAHISFYYVIHELICFTSLIIINYVFLCRLKAKKGLFFAVLFNIIFFAFYIITIQFTNTAVVGCVAGFLSIINGMNFEERKGFKRLQVIGGIFLLILASQVRYNPFNALRAVAAAFGCAVLLTAFLKFKKDSSFKDALKNTIKKYLKTAVVLIIAAAIVFGINQLSETMKYTDKDYKEFLDYNNALSSVNDYAIPNFFPYKDFYYSIGCKSYAEPTILRSWCVDDDFFTYEKLKALGDFAEKNARDGLGSKSSFKKLFAFIGAGLGEHVKSGLIIIEAVVLVVLLFFLWIMYLLAKDKFKKIMPPVLFAVFWGVFYLLAGGPLGGLDHCNLLVLPIAVFTVAVAALYNKYQQIYSIFLSLIVVALYTYLSLSRIHFSAALCFFMPAYILMIYSLKEENRKSFNFKKHPNLLKRIFAVVLAVASVATSVLLFVNYTYVEYPEDYKEVEAYIDKHQDNLFLRDGIFRTDNNFNVLLKPKEQDNVICFGGWDKKSRTYKESMKAHGIKHLFPETIDSNIVVILFNYSKNKDYLANREGLFKLYYNDHYAPKGKYVDFKKIKSFPRYAMYKVVTKKLPKKYRIKEKGRLLALNKH